MGGSPGLRIVAKEMQNKSEGVRQRYARRQGYSRGGSRLWSTAQKLPKGGGKEAAKLAVVPEEGRKWGGEGTSGTLELRPARVEIKMGSWNRGRVKQVVNLSNQQKGKEVLRPGPYQQRNYRLNARWLNGGP